MSNIIISPQSGILEFNTGAASGSAFDGSLSGAARLKFESSGVLGLTSLGTGVTDKFTIDGSNGRLFTVNNTVTGSIFSVNDVAGLPIVEVFSDDRVVMGQYATDALVVSGSGVSFATTPTVNGNPIMTGVNPFDEDTLQSVTDRGAITTNNLEIQGAGSKAFTVDSTNSHASLVVDRHSTSYDANLSFQTNGATKWRLWNNGNDSTFSIRDEVNTSNVMTWEVGGNVGIGTDDPDANLEIKKVADDAFVKVSTDGAGAWFQTDSTNQQYQGFKVGHNWFMGQYASNDFVIKNGLQSNGTAVLTIQDTTDNVGIGTTSPAAKLHLDVTTEDNQPAFKITKVSDQGENAMEVNHGTTSSARGIADFTNSAGSVLYLRGDGNVGIGTASPARNLSVASDSANVVMQLANSTTTYAADNGLEIFVSDNDAGIVNRENGYLRFDTNNLERVRILSNGNVGIGTTAAAQKLTVRGGVSATNSANIPVATLTNSSDDGRLVLNQAAGVTKVLLDTDGVSYFNGGNVGIGTNNPQEKLHVYSTSNSRVEAEATTEFAALKATNNQGSFGWYVHNTTDSFRLFDFGASTDYITVSGNGNVGIGTASPKTLLDVDAAANHGIRIGTNNALIGEGGATGTQLLFWNGSSAYYGRSAAPFNHTVSNHFFRVGGNDQMAITSVGVGIGTATPAQKLHVEFANTDTSFSNGAGGDWGSEGLLIENTSSTANTMAMIQLRNGDADFHIAGIRQGTNDNDLGFFAEGSEKVRITKDGRVGIGTTNPSVPLEVTGDIFANGGPAGGRSLALKRTGATNAWKLVQGHTQTDYLEILEGSDTRFLIKNGGDVGIGTTNPHALLEVSNNSDDATLIVSNKTNGANGAYLRLLEAGTAFNTYGYLGGYIQYDGNNNLINIGRHNVNGTTFSDDVPAISIKRSDGNVGIGTTNPDELLRVVGGNICVTNGQYLIFDGAGSKNHKMRSYYDGSQGRVEIIVGGTDVMDLAADGSVGIGTTTQSTQFYNNLVVGNNSAGEKGITIRSNASNGGHLAFSDTDAQDAGRYAGRISYFHNTNKMQFYTTAGDHAMTIDDAQKVGIGITNPDVSLHIFSTNAAPLKIQRNEVNCSLHTKNNADDVYFGVNTHGNAAIGHNLDQTSATFQITSAGNVGIGTTNPATALDVNGNITAARFLQDTNAGNNFYAAGFTRSSSSLTSPDIYDLNGHGLVLGGASTEGTLVVKAGGNVGIGTNDPVAQLTVQGDNADFMVRSNDYTISRIIPRGDTSSNWDKGLFSLMNASTEAVRIDSASSSWFNGGNVGIGTDGPAALLHVYNSAGPTIRFERNSTSKLDWEFGTANISMVGGGELQFRANGGTSNKFVINNSLITASADLYVNADVGIGTNNPEADLSIVNTAGIVGMNLKAAADNICYIDFGDSSDNNIGGINYSNINDTLNFRAGNTNRVTILSNGNVGIGTTNPTAKLQVQGTAKVTGHTDLQSTVDISNTTRIYTKLSVGNSAWIDPSQVLEVGTNTDVSAQIGRAHVGYMGFADHAGFAHLDNATTSNYSLLQSDAGDTFINSAASRHIYFRDGNATIGGFNSNDDFYVNTDTLYVDASTDRVGVNTSSPVEALDVVGLIRFGHTRADNSQKIGRLLVPEYNNSHGQFLAFMGTANQTSNAVSYGGGTSSADAATTLLFYTASAVNTTVGTERMRITSAGNVGIGVSSDPSSKLHVNGELTASTKTFDIEHPTQSGKRLVHGCFEGPEHGVYFRGKTQDSGIQAPEYWSGLVDIDSMTVDVTPIGANQSIYVDRIENNGDVYVGANTEVPLNYFYIVYGERKDIDNLVIVKDAPVGAPNEHID